MTTNFSPGENKHGATESQMWKGAHPPTPHPQPGVTADATDSDRFPRPKPQTNGVFAMVENDIANEQPEQAGFRCNTTETNGYTKRTPAKAEVRSGAKGN